MTIVSPEAEIDRDRYGRPLVLPRTGGKRVAYTRCTTYVDCLEDKFNLQRWMQRMVAVGLSQSPDLMLGVSATDPTDKRALDRFCEQAMERAKSGAAATTGTALHALTETIDRGQELPVIPGAYKADLAAYVEATKELSATHIEQFCVQDELKVGGTPDRIVRYQGGTYIADVKTGSIEFGILKIAMQLAMYARSEVYDIRTGARSHHGADTARGIIIHLPAGIGTCTLHWIDLEVGWDAVRIARQVRDKRALKFGDLTAPFATGFATQATVQEVDKLGYAVDNAQPLPSPTQERLDVLIRACATADEVRELWARHSTIWLEEHSDLAKTHIASLEAQAS